MGAFVHGCGAVDLDVFVKDQPFSAFPRIATAAHPVFSHKSFDHWNTASWEGCTKTLDVDLGRCWQIGANQAKTVLRRHDLYSEDEVDFATISGTGNIDLMRPKGILIGHSEVE